MRWIPCASLAMRAARNCEARCFLARYSRSRPGWRGTRLIDCRVPGLADTRSTSLRWPLFNIALYTYDVKYDRSLRADHVIDVQTARFEDRAKNVDVISIRSAARHSTALSQSSSLGAFS